MIGLVLVTHGKLADELRSAMEHVVGRQKHVATVCIGPEDDIESRRAEIRQCIENVDMGDGVVLLTDMFGGTPSNLAISQMDRPGVDVIAGVNLPMLVKLAKVRCDRPIAAAVECAQTAGRKYIACASDVLPHCHITNPVVAEALGVLPPCGPTPIGKLNGDARVNEPDGPASGPPNDDQGDGPGNAPGRDGPENADPSDGPDKDGQGAAPAPDVITRTLVICNARGLHARAAAKFVTLAERFGASVDVVKAGNVVSARSIMGLMMLGAGQGTPIELRAEGWDAREALDALAALVEAGFHEQG